MKMHSINTVFKREQLVMNKNFKIGSCQNE